ncbi:MAG: iron-sulfur cluster assembly scaffold protein [Candidatus Sulfotelmatobacter sp.]
MYSELVREHYLHPRNVGNLPNPSGTAMVRSPFDSDTVLVTLRIEDNRIADVRFKCVGCPVAIASSSIATEMIMGKPVEEAYALSKEDVAAALGGMPDYKMLCSNLSPDAIRLAIDDWRSRVAAGAISGGG